MDNDGSLHYQLVSYQYHADNGTILNVNFTVPLSLTTVNLPKSYADSQSPSPFRFYGKILHDIKPQPSPSLDYSQALLWPYHNHTTVEHHLSIPATLPGEPTSSISFLLGYPQGDGGDDQDTEGPSTRDTQTLPVSLDKQLPLQQEDPYVDYYYVVMLDGSRMPILPVDTQTALKIMFLRDQYERMNHLEQHRVRNITELYILWTPSNTTESGDIPMRFTTSSQSSAYKNQPAVGVIATVVAGILLVALFFYAFHRKRKFSLSEALDTLQDHLTTLQHERQLQQFHDAGVRYVSVEHPPLDPEVLDRYFPRICLSEQDLPLIQTVYDAPSNLANLESQHFTPSDNLHQSLTLLPSRSSPCDPVDRGARPLFQSFCSGMSIGALLPRSVSMTFERQYSDPTPLQRAQTCRSWHERVALRASANIFRPHSLNIESSSVAPLTATTIAVSPTDHNWSGDSSSCPQSYYNASKDELGVSEQSQLEVISTRPRGTNIQVPSTLSPSPLKPTPTRPPSLLDSLRKLPPLKLPQSGKLDEQASLPNLCHSEHLGRSRPGKPASLFQPDRYSVGTWRSLRSLRSIRSLKIIPFLTGWEAINDQEDFPESSITSNSVVPVESTPGAFQPQRSRLRDNESSDIQTPAKLMEPVQLNQPNDCASPPVTDDVDTPLCAICFESFASGDTIRRLFCAHIYHVDCIDPWLLRVASTCPLCKRSCAAPLPVPHIEDESTEPVSRVHSALPQTNALATTGGQNSGFDHTSL